MSGPLTRDAYVRLIQENREWLAKQPRTLERDHIDLILRASADHEYGTTLAELRADRDNASRVVTELTAEVEKLRARNVELEKDNAALERETVAAEVHRLLAERDSLKAKLAESEDQRSRAYALLDRDNNAIALVEARADFTAIISELECEPTREDALAEIARREAEVESLKAQLAEAQKRIAGLSARVATECRPATMENGEFDTEGFALLKRAESAEEQLRVAHEALEWMISAESDWEDGEIGVGHKFRHRARAALSASAPKVSEIYELRDGERRAIGAPDWKDPFTATPQAEPCVTVVDLCVRCERPDHLASNCPQSVPSQDLPCPCCDDVMLMRVAEAVMEAVVVKLDACTSALTDLDLAAIVAEVKR